MQEWEHCWGVNPGSPTHQPRDFPKARRHVWSTGRWEMIIITTWLTEGRSRAPWAGGRGQSCRGRDRRVRVGAEEPEDNGQLLRQPLLSLNSGSSRVLPGRNRFKCCWLAPAPLSLLSWLTTSVCISCITFSLEISDFIFVDTAPARYLAIQNHVCGMDARRIPSIQWALRRALRPSSLYMERRQTQVSFREQ